MNRRCRVLICDDHANFRDLLKTVLQEDQQIEVVGEARNGKEVVDKALRLRPAVVLMDLNMPELTGLEATRRIRRASKRIKILILSAFDDEEVVPRCLSAGASGFFQKYRPLSELPQAIEAVRRGKIYLKSHVCAKVSRAGGSTFY